MGALRLYGQRRAIGAKGGLFGALAKKAIGGMARSIPGVGLVTTAASMAKTVMPAKPKVGPLAFGTGLVTGAVTAPFKVAKTVGTRAMQAFEAPRKKYRRQNVGNMKALRRAIRRIQGAEKLFRQVLSVQGKKSAGIKPKRK